MASSHFSWMFAALLSLALAYPCQASEPSPGSAFKRGLNITGSQAFWSGKDNGAYRSIDMASIKSAGFDHVRVNAMAFESMDAELHLDAEWLRRLDMVVNGASEAGLAVIIDLHEHRACADDADLCESKTVAFWRQLSAHYRQQPQSVAFEILNEPHGAITAERWNSLAATGLSVIRANNPDRTVVIGPAQSNNYKSLQDLQLPSADRNILVTFHYYSPFDFTHQGATWTKAKYAAVGQWQPDKSVGLIRADFDKAQAWAKKHQRPLLLGEFGAINTTDLKSRVGWTRTVVSLAEQSGFGWSYWNFNGDAFGVFDRRSKSWIPEMRDVLSSRGHPTKESGQ